ncbi:arylsulfatase B-like isoform X2 [Palaemon carinicauda]|uniref:arylsulfatase B-like isoform X2 n=1 Tax=Palaemon carinicauda TaxID=392227 RepID=UPI0035B59AF4
MHNAQGWNDVPWNNPYVIAPHMSDLAVNGVILNQSYVQPTCTPTRAALMTGRYPFTIGLQQGVIGPLEPMGVPLQSKMLPQFLKKVGYTTHAIGKWHLGFCSWEYTPLRRGFDTFYGFYTGSADHYSHKRPTITKGKRTEYLDLRNNTKVDNGKGGVYSTYVYASAAEEIIRSRKPEDPMFMYLAFQSVHSPLQVPLQYKTQYSHIKYFERRVYLGMVTAMDEAIGKVVKALKETGHYENSVIIFTTDNGGSVRKGGSNWPLRGGKGALWEGGTRGPAFIHSPLLPNPGTVNENLHHATDWFSTIISIAGGEPPEVDGTNQWDVLAGISTVPQRETIVYNMDDSKKFKAGLRMNNYKLLVGGMARKSWVSTPESEDAPRRRRRPKGFSKKQIVQLFKPSSVIPLHKKTPVSKLTLSGNEPSMNVKPLKLSSLLPLDKKTPVPKLTLSGNKPSTDVQLLKLFSLLPLHKKTPVAELTLSGNEASTNDQPLKPSSVPPLHKTTQVAELSLSDNESSMAVHNDSSHLEPINIQQVFPVQELVDDGSMKIASLTGPQSVEKDLLKMKMDDYIFWNEFKYDPSLQIENRVLNILGGYFRDRTKIRLYNLEDDPEERTNLSDVETNTTLLMLSYLAEELVRYKIPLIRRDNNRGHPMHWQDVWTPGWCTAQW